MFICVCHAVRDCDVDRAIDGGACTREQVTAACGAGGDCGACHLTIEERIEAKQELVAADALVRRERAA
jgi:bacterioferritin-associated ferredoxin